MKNNRMFLAITLLMSMGSSLFGTQAVPVQENKLPVDLVMNKVDEFVNVVREGKTVDEMVNKAAVLAKENIKHLPLVIMGVGMVDPRLQALALKVETPAREVLVKVLAEPVLSDGTVSPAVLNTFTQPVADFVKKYIVPEAKKTLTVLDSALQDLTATFGLMRIGVEMFPMVIDQMPNIPDTVKTFVKSDQFAKAIARANAVLDILEKKEFENIRNLVVKEMRKILFEGEYSVSKLVDVLEHKSVPEIKEYLQKYYAANRDNAQNLVTLIKPQLPQLVQSLKSEVQKLQA